MQEKPHPRGGAAISLPRGLLHIAVSKPADAYTAGSKARAMARDAGFGESEAEEIALCATELANNLVLHAGGGIFGLRVIGHGERKGVEMYSEDHGPGIPNLEARLADGNSTRGGLGCGLGTVHRLMDSMDVFSPTSPEGGTIVRCGRMAKPGHASLPGCPLDVGSATRACPGQRFNGDSFVVKAWEGNVLAGVIDGLGHGRFAYQAALASRLYVESHFDMDPGHLLQGVDRVCRATRGVVMALSLFDWERSRLTLAAVGNVEIRHWGPSKFSFVSRRGYLGSGMRPASVAQLDWTPKDVLVMSSDGLRNKWTWADHPVLARESAQEAAWQLLRAHARDSDDATVLVVKGHRHPRPSLNEPVEGCGHG